MGLILVLRTLLERRISWKRSGHDRFQKNIAQSSNAGRSLFFSKQVRVVAK